MLIFRVQQSKQSGFTLIELLIVMLLLALVVGGISQSISLSKDTGKNWLSQAGDDVHNMMVLGGTRHTDVGFFLTATGYQWMAWDSDADDGSGEWTAMSAVVKTQKLPDGFSMNITNESRGELTYKPAQSSSSGAPSFVIKRDGELVPPVSIRVSELASQKQWAIIFDGIHAPEWLESIH